MAGKHTCIEKWSSLHVRMCANGEIGSLWIKLKVAIVSFDVDDDQTSLAVVETEITGVGYGIAGSGIKGEGIGGTALGAVEGVPLRGDKVSRQIAFLPALIGSVDDRVAREGFVHRIDEKFGVVVRIVVGAIETVLGVGSSVPLLYELEFDVGGKVGRVGVPGTEDLIPGAACRTGC